MADHYPVGILTFAIRLSFIDLHHPLAGRLALLFAVFSAIIFPEIFVQGNTVAANPRLIAGALAVLIAWRTCNGYPLL